MAKRSSVGICAAKTYRLREKFIKHVFLCRRWCRLLDSRLTTNDRLSFYARNSERQSSSIVTDFVCVYLKAQVNFLALVDFGDIIESDCINAA